MSWRSAILQVKEKISQIPEQETDRVLCVQAKSREIEILPAIFSADSVFPQFYFSSLEKDVRVLGLGQIAEFQSSELSDGKFSKMMDLINEKYLSVMGVVNFSSVDGAWFFCPQIELRVEQNTAEIICRIKPGSSEDVIKQKQSLTFLLQSISDKVTNKQSPVTSISKKYSVRDIFSKDEYYKAVNKILEQIEARELSKVVLARKTRYEFESAVDSYNFFAKLVEFEPKAYHFFVRRTKNESFLGASPERLFRRSDRRVLTEAQAGTRLLGRDYKETQEFEDELLKSAKEAHEHNLVLQEISNVLREVCLDSGVISKRQISRFANVQHLKSMLGGILRSKVSDWDLLEKLHPTPAVCGLPKKLAQKMIKESEPFNRGAYAGAVGFIGQMESEFCVGLRAAEIKSNTVSLLGGAGIVKGSKPGEEWQEIESKLNSLTRVCQGYV